MKIIGKTERGFILESSEDEVANLIGHYSAYTNVDGCPKLNMGDIICVHSMYKQLYDIKHKAGELSKISKTLRQVADLVELHDPIEHIAKADNDGLRNMR